MDNFICDIRLFAGDTPPSGWLFCDGQLLPIPGEYDALFSLLHTTFGGDGVHNFALPKLPPFAQNVQYMICVLGEYPHVDDPRVPGDAGNPENYIIGYLGEIRVFPAGMGAYLERWEPCLGQQIIDNKAPDRQLASGALYDILGNKFGGTNMLAYGLPNLYKEGDPLAYYICIEGEFPSPG
jgi:microcystin-dependent protein